MSPRGTPGAVTRRYEEASVLVRVVVYLERGALEDLELLVRHGQPGASRSEVVRQTVAALRARRAVQLVRLRDVRRRRRAEEEARAASVSREQAERERVEDAVAEALKIVATKRSVG